MAGGINNNSLFNKIREILVSAWKVQRYESPRLFDKNLI